MALTAVRSKAGVLLIVVDSLLLPLFLGFCVWSLLCVLSSFITILLKMEKLNPFTLINILLSRGFECSVFRPQRTEGRSVYCEIVAIYGHIHLFNILLISSNHITIKYWL